MRIEVLYVPGCPNYEPAVERMKKVLAAESLQVDVEGIAVDYNYLVHELIPEDGRIKAANLMPVDDGIERTYRPELFEWGRTLETGATGVQEHEYRLVLHLFEQDGIEHVAY